MPTPRRRIIYTQDATKPNPSDLKISLSGWLTGGDVFVKRSKGWQAKRAFGEPAKQLLIEQYDDDDDDDEDEVEPDSNMEVDTSGSESGFDSEIESEPEPGVVAVKPRRAALKMKKKVESVSGPVKVVKTKTKTYCLKAQQKACLKAVAAPSQDSDQDDATTDDASGSYSSSASSVKDKRSASKQFKTSRSKAKVFKKTKPPREAETTEKRANDETGAETATESEEVAEGEQTTEAEVTTTAEAETSADPQTDTNNDPETEPEANSDPDPGPEPEPEPEQPDSGPAIDDATETAGADATDDEWTPSQDALLLSMKDGGETWTTIGRALGRGKKESQRRWKVLTGGSDMKKKHKKDRKNKHNKDNSSLFSNQPGNDTSDDLPKPKFPSARAHRRAQADYILSRLYRNSDNALHLRADAHFGEGDCATLAAIDSRARVERWLELQAAFFNATGRMVPVCVLKGKVLEAEAMRKGV